MYEPQLPGTAIILNILQYHHCVPDSRIKRRGDEYWIGLSIEYNQKPTVNQVEESFRKIMELK